MDKFRTDAERKNDATPIECCLQEQACYLGEPIPEKDVPPPIEHERLLRIAKHLDELATDFTEDEITILRYRLDRIEENAHSAEDTALAFGVRVERVHILESRASRLLRKSRLRTYLE